MTLTFHLTTYEGVSLSYIVNVLKDSQKKHPFIIDLRAIKFKYKKENPIFSVLFLSTALFTYEMYSKVKKNSSFSIILNEACNFMWKPI